MAFSERSVNGVKYIRRLDKLICYSLTRETLRSSRQGRPFFGKEAHGVASQGVAAGKRHGGIDAGTRGGGNRDSPAQQRPENKNGHFHGESAQLHICLARPRRFERPTPAFGGQYSIQLSYGRRGIDVSRFGSNRATVDSGVAQMRPGPGDGGIIAPPDFTSIAIVPP